jgi:hypothetical protein
MLALAENDHMVRKQEASRNVLFGSILTQFSHTSHPIPVQLCWILLKMTIWPGNRKEGECPFWFNSHSILTHFSSNSSAIMLDLAESCRIIKVESDPSCFSALLTQFFRK